MCSATLFDRDKNNDQKLFLPVVGYDMSLTDVLPLHIHVTATEATTARYQHGGFFFVHTRGNCRHTATVHCTAVEPILMGEDLVDIFA